MSERRVDSFKIFAFLPMATFVVLRLYVGQFDGWGAWGAAPLLLIPIILALPITIAGLIRIGSERADGRVATSTIALTTLAGLPLLWFLWRLVVSS
ncbi:MAG: hypothetical protein OEU54_02485 [Gemmatimonadota bacterium]|nr:hypothetical protein [Gemmatimonadota bacterium]